MLQRHLVATGPTDAQAVAALRGLDPGAGAAADADAELPVRQLLLGQAQIHAKAFAQRGDQYQPLQHRDVRGASATGSEDG